MKESLMVVLCAKREALGSGEPWKVPWKKHSGRPSPGWPGYQAICGQKSFLCQMILKRNRVYFRGGNRTQ